MEPRLARGHRGAVTTVGSRGGRGTQRRRWARRASKRAQRSGSWPPNVSAARATVVHLSAAVCVQSISGRMQPFSQKSRTPTVAKEFQIGLCGPAESDEELFCNSWSAGFLGERLYASVIYQGNI